MALNDRSTTRLTEILGRELPYSLEAEQAVLGGVLLAPEVLPSVIEILRPEYFYRPQHQLLFSIMMRMFTTAQTEDIITVIDESVTAGVFETSAMAKAYLSGLMEGVPSTANIESYCRIIEEKYHIRALMSVADEILETAAEGNVDSRTMLDNAEQKIYDIRQGKDIQGLSRIDSVIIDAYDHLQQISGPESEKYLGARTGFSQLDNIITGLNKSDLIIIAARPGVGKTAFAANIAVNMCRRTMKEVVMFSLEMGKEQLALRMLSSESMVNNTSLRSGKINADDWIKLAEGTERLSKLPIYLDDSGSANVPQMKAKLRRMRNLGLVVIDYLQLMSSPNKHNNRVTEVSEITRQLKLMAKELNVPVIALSQLTRSSEKRDDKRPMLSDLRESGSIEQDADIILFLYRDAYYNKEGDKSSAECIVAKNRHGTIDTIKLSWLGEYTLFRGVDFGAE